MTKRLSILLAAIAVAAPAFADDLPAPALGDRAEKAIQEALPVCAGPATTSRVGVQHKLPSNMTGAVIRVESERQICQGQWVAVVTKAGDFFMGVPWFLDGMTGTPEAKLKNFGWKNLQQNFEPVINQDLTRDGLRKVTLFQITERGKLPMKGELDPDAGLFFIGQFHPLSADFLQSRLQVFQPFIDAAPTMGAAKPAVTVVEFSDFECPSCQRAAGYMKPIIEKYGEQVRYVRYDLPLVSIHPWAFEAAVAGRAIWRQKPDLFWQYKERVYAEQDKLSAFTFADFARGFAQDHELNMARFDADVNSAELRASMLDAAGTALSNDVRATPTYMVNGRFVDAGEGKGLESYVARLLGKAATAPATPGPEKTSTSGR